jgi:hypothetical protein
MFIPTTTALLVPVLVPVTAATMTTNTRGAFSDEKLRVKCRQILKKSKNKRNIKYTVSVKPALLTCYEYPTLPSLCQRRCPIPGSLCNRCWSERQLVPGFEL